MGWGREHSVALKNIFYSEGGIPAVRDIDAEMSALRRLESKGAVSPRAVDKARELADIKKDRIKQGLTVDGGERD